ncbi:MAG: hypothetical protein ASARMPRED_006962 [Alectoria sarmentosa]|nr:MAG: hypothetical protein ASARMPRED_006962 [Alectoria sarmentosa]
MSKPTFIFVPGAWHTPSCFSLVTARLAKHGYTSHGLSLPSVGANPGLPDFSADVCALRDLINKLISAAEDVVVVLWSYAGVVGTEAVLPAMLKRRRETEGQSGGVVHLVYLAAFLLPVGEGILMGGRPQSVDDDDDVLRYDWAAGTVSVNPAMARPLFYNDVEDQALVEDMSRNLRSMSVGAFRSRLTRAAWEYTPATLVLCERDGCMDRGRREQRLRAARDKCPGAVGRVERCGAGHAPFLSMPDRVVEILRRAAGEEV